MWCLEPSSVEHTSNTNARHSNVSWVSLLVTTCSDGGVKIAVMEGLKLAMEWLKISGGGVKLAVMEGLKDGD